MSYTSSSGNTDSTNLNASLNINWEAPQWKHATSFVTLRAEANGVTNTDSRVFTHRSEYTLSKRTYLFGQFRNDRDEFGAYSYQTSLSLGGGSRFISTAKHRLDLSLGPGYRKSRDNKKRITNEEGILSGNLGYEYTVSDTTAFNQALLIETGDSNTYTESKTSLRTRINAALATRLSYLIRHNSKAPAGVENTDEIAAISLVYSF